MRVSAGSGVVPATGETKARFRPEILLSSEDLPTFGRPTMAIAGASGGDRDVRDLGERQRQRLTQVADAGAMLGRDQKLAVDPQAVELGEAVPRLVGVRLVDHQHG